MAIGHILGLIIIFESNPRLSTGAPAVQLRGPIGNIGHGGRVSNIFWGMFSWPNSIKTIWNWTWPPYISDRQSVLRVLPWGDDGCT